MSDTHTPSSVEPVERTIVRMCDAALVNLQQGCERVFVQEWIGGVYITLSQLGLRGGGIWSFGVPQQGQPLEVTDNVYEVISAVKRLVTEGRVAA